MIKMMAKCEANTCGLKGRGRGRGSPLKVGEVRGKGAVFDLWFFKFSFFIFLFFCMFGLLVRPLRDLADEMESIAQLQLAGVSNTEEEEARLAWNNGCFCWLLVVVAHGIN